ncbi:hypothetical protein [Bradyrhizobium sp. DASA03007]|uniref:hypothetical protein n=1 Tax=unclassified Bradyrhizobium TaxID=2631580 RepID=UPI003F6FAE13
MKSDVAAPKPPLARPINAHFKDRLPLIMSEICDSLMVIEPAIDRVRVQLREFLDYLDFEIQKTAIEVQRLRWEPQVDRAAVSEAEAWLKQLAKLEEDFNIDVMTSPPETIRKMLDRVSKMFELK